MNGKEPRFFKMVNDGNRTYELYDGDDAESAKEFLLKKQVDKPLYYITVKTDEGTWGMDKEGLFLTDLLPWQRDLTLTQCEGKTVGIPSMFNLGIAAKDVADNFVVEVRCGKEGCRFTWMDALRYQNKTVVKCPKCKSYNLIDSFNVFYHEPSLSVPGGDVGSDEPTMEKKEADYLIDYENGAIPIGDLPIGAMVVDPSWKWKYRLGVNYSDIDWEGEPTPTGEVKSVTWIVVAKDHYEGLEPHVTLFVKEPIGFFNFDNSTNRGSDFGCNHWGESGTANATRGLRPWLNSTVIRSGESFYQALSDSFKRAVLATTVPNKEWANGTAYSTQDYFLIPSTTELGDTAPTNTYQIGSAYPYFSGAADAKRVAMLGGEAVWYWSRSPASNGGGSVRVVGNAGQFYYNNANYDDGAVRPALNLKSGILVSEIKN